jgi:hypothetical protein
MQITSIAAEGLTRAQERFDGAGRRMAAGVLEPGEIVDLLAARNQVEANIALLRVASEMERRIVDLIG